jgi:protein-disulfide isomerase
MRVPGVWIVGAVLVLGGIAAAAGIDEQVIKYYRKKANVPPTAQVVLTGVKDSSIKGAKEGVLEVGQGPAAKKVPVTMSADGRYVVFAGVEDVTVDPSKAVMQKISLAGEPCKGPKDAKVTIVEYSDFQCPFCSRGYNTIEKQVLTEYKDKVKFCYKNYPLPFHPWAEAAAVAAECAKQQDPDAYWKLYSAWFENQAQVNPQNVKDKAHEFLQGTKVDMAKFDDCFDNKKSLDKVKAQQAEGSSVGVTGTPGFIINGRLLVGAQPFEQFKAVIDDELASAK